MEIEQRTEGDVTTLFLKGKMLGGVGDKLLRDNTELLSRHKVLQLLRDREPISQQRTDLLPSWRYSGFSVHNHTTFDPSDTKVLHRLACYLLRPPVHLSSLAFIQSPSSSVMKPKSASSSTMKILRSSGER